MGKYFELHPAVIVYRMQCKACDYDFSLSAYIDLIDERGERTCEFHQQVARFCPHCGQPMPK